MEDLTRSQLYTNDLIKRKPSAMAWIIGNQSNPMLNGLAVFYSLSSGGVLISVEIYGLPDNGDSKFFGMHIHEFGNCTLPFDKTGNHYNPTNSSHPNHAGDLPPILSGNGYGWIAFYDKRFNLSEIIGKSIIIHNMSDDFKSQPAGNSGLKIGCGVIK